MIGIFPFSQMTINRIFKTALESAGLYSIDPKTGRATIHAHSLRKFFYTQMNGAVSDPKIVDLLIGHTGYLEPVYFRKPREEVGKIYHESYYAISLYSPENLPELKNKLENAENNSKYLIGQMVNNASEMDSLKKQMKDMQDRMERMQGVGALIQGNKDAIEAERKRREREKQ